MRGREHFGNREKAKASEIRGEQQSTERRETTFGQRKSIPFVEAKMNRKTKPTKSLPSTLGTPTEDQPTSNTFVIQREQALHLHH